jgi:hypothetical protein
MTVFNLPWGFGDRSVVSLEKDGTVVSHSYGTFRSANVFNTPVSVARESHIKCGAIDGKLIGYAELHAKASWAELGLFLKNTDAPELSSDVFDAKCWDFLKQWVNLGMPSKDSDDYKTLLAVHFDSLTQYGVKVSVVVLKFHPEYLGPQ